MRLICNHYQTKKSITKEIYVKKIAKFNKELQSGKCIKKENNHLKGTNGTKSFVTIPIDLFITLYLIPRVKSL